MKKRCGAAFLTFELMSNGLLAANGIPVQIENWLRRGITLFNGLLEVTLHVCYYCDINILLQAVRTSI